MFFYNEDDTEVSYELPVESVDPYFYNTSLLLKMDNDFSDSSVYQNSTTTSGNVTVSAAESKFGGGSGYFDGSGDYITVSPAGTELEFDSDDYTVEMWIKPTPTLRGAVFSKGTNSVSSDFISLEFTSSDTLLYALGSTSSQLTTTTVFSSSRWYHVAVVRNGGTTSLYVDGISESSFSDSYTIANGGDFFIGRGWFFDQFNRNYNGHIDDFRVTKGIARYTSNFTPPIEPHSTTGPSEIVSDQLTFHLDSSNVNSYPGTGTTWTSLVNSSDIGTFVGDPTFNAAEADSIDLDGNGDYIQIDNTSLFDFSGDFTIEMTMKLDQIGQTNGATVILSNNILGNFQISANVDINNIRFFIGGVQADFNVTSNLIGRWCNMTLSRISGVYTVYDNAVSIGTASNNASIDSSQLFLGVQTPSRVPFLAHFTDGKIGSFRVYNKGLSSQEVLQNFHATKDRFGL